MTTALITHNDCLKHETPVGHPERVGRLQEINEQLATGEFDALMRVEAPLAEDTHLLYAHPVDHLAAIKSAAPAAGVQYLDGDTVMSQGSFQAALRAAGAIVQAVDMVMGGEVDNAFCAVKAGEFPEPLS